MSLRWYTDVVDCLDATAQSKWWAGALGRTRAGEAPDEVVLVPGYVDDRVVAETPWERVSSGLAFVPVPEGSGPEVRAALPLVSRTRMG